MASQTPTSVIPTDLEALSRHPYAHGWAAMTQLMMQGSSWSGRERNCCFLNMGDGTFVDASAISGLDFVDDGRSLAVVDWDDDGDLDVWLRSRTGPQLRFMRNNQPPDLHYVAFRLVGKTCNRDAVGARVEVEAGGKHFSRYVVAGDGYLGQSSKRLHFGLGDSDRIEQVVVHWPGGDTQKFVSIEVDHAYRVEQGSPLPVKIETRAFKLADGGVEKPEASSRAGVVLRQPLPLPPSVRAILPKPSGDRATLINLWAQWCRPCIGELSEFAEHYAEMNRAGLDILALNVDDSADHEKARQVFAERIASKMGEFEFKSKTLSRSQLDTLDALRVHILGRAVDMSLPTSFLIDATGVVRILYVGPVGPQALLDDLDRHIMRAQPAHRRSSYAGRWYYNVPRNLQALARDLKDRGHEADYQYYLTMVIERLKQRQGLPGGP